MPDDRGLRLDFPHADVARLTLDGAGRVNLLTPALLDALDEQLTALATRASLRGLLVASAKPGSFVAGADLTEVAAACDLDADAKRGRIELGQRILSRLMSLPGLTIALIDGVCLGGGAELAAWCDVRLAARESDGEIGFPETRLGLLPAWGGAALLPRIVGLAAAVDWITDGQAFNPPHCRRLGFVDEIAARDELLTAGLAWIERADADAVRERRRTAKSRGIDWPQAERDLLSRGTRAKLVANKLRHPAAPLTALETLVETAAAPLEAALARSVEATVPLLGSPPQRGLLKLHFLTDRHKRQLREQAAVASDIPLAPIGIVGAGIMGQGIAAACVKRGLPVRLLDMDDQRTEAAVDAVVQEVGWNKQTRKFDPELALRRAPLLTAVSDETHLAGCGLIVEAIIEELEPKQRLFDRLERIGPDAILGSNTSTLPISAIAASMQAPDRLVGLHFFNPVRYMRLVEVIPGQRDGGQLTSPEALAAALRFARQVGKTPIVVGDGPGFLVNRLLTPYINEALQLLSEGWSISEVDGAARAFGIPMGPLEICDMVGLDTTLHCGRVMWDALPDRVLPSPILPALVKRGRLGQKNGRGFYLHAKQRPPRPDPDVDEVLEKYRRDARVASDRDGLADRMILPMLAEAARALDDRTARQIQDIDLGVVLGLGFPAHLGGLLGWADQVGLDQILAGLDRYQSLGKRFEAPESLRALVRRQSSFYASGVSAEAAS